MARIIVLVACVGKKQKFSSPAKDLYVSTWFRKAADYARKFSDEWYILSAKHGLVDPDEVLEPYDDTLNEMSSYQRKEWANRVLHRLTEKLNPNDSVIFLAGQKYRDNLIKPIEEIGCSIDIPIQGKRIGEQLSWFNKRLRS